MKKAMTKQLSRVYPLHHIVCFSDTKIDWRENGVFSIHSVCIWCLYVLVLWVLGCITSHPSEQLIVVRLSLYRYHFSYDLEASLYKLCGALWKGQHDSAHHAVVSFQSKSVLDCLSFCVSLLLGATEEEGLLSLYLHY